MAAVQKRKIRWAISLFLMMLYFSGLTAQAQYGGGSGEPNEPYLIYTAEQMNAIGAEPNDWDKHFKLMSDVDLSGYSYDRALIAPDTNDANLEFDGTPFNGTFDGKAHTIVHLTITGGSYLGLFGQLGSRAAVSNLGLEAVDVNGTGGYVGGLVGQSYRGSIKNCYSSGMVTGAFDVGGLVGKKLYGSITESYSTSTVTGSVRVGGLVGWHYHVSLMFPSSITMSYSTGKVTGDRSVGGLVGVNEGDVTNSFWDIETSGQTTSDGGTGKTTAEMQDPKTFMAVGWDFVGQPDGPHDMWVEPEGGGYPVLWWQVPPDFGLPGFAGGKGEPNDPYLISTVEELNTIGHNPRLMESHFMLIDDLDLTDLHFYPISSYDYPYLGVFDGNGHVISHLMIEGESYIGLFGLIGDGAEVKDLGVVDVNITGSYSVGGLAGMSEGSITSSYSTGSVSGDRYYVGGLVGINWYGRITTSYSTGTVSGDDDVGGLVGRNHEGIISTSYSTGTVSGSVLHRVWDTQTYSTGGIGLTTPEMMDPYMLGLNGFANDPNWILDAGRDYPRLAWEGTAGQIIPEPIIDWLDGKGTDQEPYRVDTADQLILLGKASILWDKHFVLGADINLDPNLPGRQVFSQAVIQVFSGVFDGNDRTISHLTISGESYLGLFGQLNSGAKISNLGLEAVDVNGTSLYVGGLVGYNNGSIATSYSTGTVSGASRVGGLVGWNHSGGTITNCYSTGSVSGREVVGGLVGRNYEGMITTSYSTCTVNSNSRYSPYSYVGGLVGGNSGSITTSYSTGTVTGNRDVGGLVGENHTGRITSSYSTGSVSGGDWVVGGLVGSNYKGIISTSYSTGTVSGDRYVGGLVGTNTFGSITTSYSTGTVSGDGFVGGLVGRNGEGTITTSYSTGTVSGTSRVGGLVGSNSGSITTSYSTGTVSGTSRVGGLVGSNYRNITSSFWDVETSGLTNMCGSQPFNYATGCDDSFGKTTSEMQTSSTFLDAGWDFVDETANGTDDIWWILEGKDYPRLCWELIEE